MAERIRFGLFEFDPGAGELLHTNGSEAGTPCARIPPQPAQLLCLLLENYPDVVSRDEIRKAIWSDVEVDFDRSLHFCIRQIRSALNESAAAPQFIETIPRRGYRWLVQPERIEVVTPAVATAACTAQIDSSVANEALESVMPLNQPRGATPTVRLQRRSPHLLRVLLPLLAIAIAIGLILFQLWRPVVPSPGAVTRVAIMPFEPHGTIASTFRGNSIAEELLAALAEPIDTKLQVIGPTTTVQYDEPRQQLRRLISELKIDFIANGRFTSTDDAERLLVEIIRGADGAHVWVKYFDASSETRDIVAETAAALREQLKLAEDRASAE